MESVLWSGRGGRLESRNYSLNSTLKKNRILCQTIVSPAETYITRNLPQTGRITILSPTKKPHRSTPVRFKIEKQFFLCQGKLLDDLLRKLQSYPVLCF